MVHHDKAFCRKVARLGIEAADALDHAHALGVLHRDIKPANLLIDRAGAVWITDFGLARFSGNQSLTGTGDVVGTLRYMSPEQALARRGVVDQRTDIYALGATLYELLTLRPAFGGRDHQELLHQIAFDEPVPPSRLNPAVPRDLETIVLKAMAKDPSSRYATAQELSEDLKRFLNDDSIMGRRPGPVERAVRWARRRWELVATAAAIVMVSLIIGTAVTLHQARETQRLARETKEARNKYRDYIIKHFPLLDRSAVKQVGEAGALLQSAADPATRRQAFQLYDQVLNIFQEASELPPTDKESRVVIARALCRLAYTRTMLSFQKGTGGSPEPKLMAGAGSDFRRSVALFEKLLEEERGEPIIRRYFADALGLYGMGCFLRFTHRPQDAERCYRNAIDLRRDLIRGIGSGVVADAGPRIDDPDEREDLLLLAYTVQVVSSMMQAAGRAEEAESLRHRLVDDFIVAADRFSGPEFQAHRLYWARALTANGSFSPDPDTRRMTFQNALLATILAPESAVAHNNVAWALASVPDDPWFDPKQGLAEARKATKLDSKNSAFWNTLGVAAFRARDWKTAHDALGKSIETTGGSAHDWFFLAMTHWKEGNRREARQCFDMAVSSMKQEQKDDPELIRFHTEAATLLGLPVPKTGREIGMAGNSVGTVKSARE
jgi:tetratricopeptide (TPR) repeat protein